MAESEGVGECKSAILFMPHLVPQHPNLEFTWGNCKYEPRPETNLLKVE